MAFVLFSFVPPFLAQTLSIAKMSQVQSFRREVTGVAGTDMRCDFLCSHPDGSHTILEVIYT